MVLVSWVTDYREGSIGTNGWNLTVFDLGKTGRSPREYTCAQGHFGSNSRVELEQALNFLESILAPQTQTLWYKSRRLANTYYQELNLIITAELQQLSSLGVSTYKLSLIRTWTWWEWIYVSDYICNVTNSWLQLRENRGFWVPATISDVWMCEL